MVVAITMGASDTMLVTTARGQWRPRGGSRPSAHIWRPILGSRSQGEGPPRGSDHFGWPRLPALTLGEVSLGAGGRGEEGVLPGSVRPGLEKQQCGPRWRARQRQAGVAGHPSCCVASWRGLGGLGRDG